MFCCRKRKQDGLKAVCVGSVMDLVPALLYPEFEWTIVDMDRGPQDVHAQKSYVDEILGEATRLTSKGLACGCLEIVATEKVAPILAKASVCLITCSQGINMCSAHHCPNLRTIIAGSSVAVPFLGFGINIIQLVPWSLFQESTVELHVYGEDDDFVGRVLRFWKHCAVFHGNSNHFLSAGGFCITDV